MALCGRCVKNENCRRLGAGDLGVRVCWCVVYASVCVQAQRERKREREREREM
jgi:hypothetical protein